jgi:hypothetical protein
MRSQQFWQKACDGDCDEREDLMAARAAGAVDGKLKGRLENVCWQRVQMCSEDVNPRFWL